jgi:hypothetical protein
MMAARFKRHVEVGPIGRLSSGLQGNHLCVRPARPLVISLPDDAPILCYDGTHDGVWTCATPTSLSEEKGEPHQLFVSWSKHFTRYSTPNFLKKYTELP